MLTDTAIASPTVPRAEIVAFDARTGFSTGCGFSDLFPQPSYQRAAVGRYLEFLGDEFAGFFDPAGRAYPDVPEQGYRYVIMYNGTADMQDGTSASMPTVVAVVSLINDALRGRGPAVAGVPESVDLLDCISRVYGHYLGVEPRLQHDRLSCSGRLGPSDGFRISGEPEFSLY
ncbi:hypothetical protein GGR54DRAFT_645234 [Hypoxylon sp. NC1633]|nr:hypothetical protein GGR54DRAFT_645234 [Hypoxylon sp. NC1633]